MAVGRVIRFDGMRGYGFIAPESGGEDVFLHVNDLLIPEATLRSGLAVEFQVEDGDRGPKASSVRLAEQVVGPQAVARSAEVAAAAAVKPPVQAASQGDPSGAAGSETLCDVLSATEYTTEVTEILLSSAPELTAHQINSLRRQLLPLGKRHGWVED